jgi:hypothetical protein
MSIQRQERLGAGLVLGMAVPLVLRRRHLGVLNAASWLVILGAGHRDRPAAVPAVPEVQT